MNFKNLLPSIFLSFFGYVQAQSHDSLEIVKKGWNFGAIPALGYNSDLGYLYGAAVNIFNYGDGSKYPEYKYSLYMECSRYTKGSGINTLFFDSKYLLPKNIRITVDASYLTNRLLNFFGFNGYDAVYNPAYENPGSNDYISRAFYRLDRKVKRLLVDFQHPVGGSHVRWIAGVSYFDIAISTVDINRLNKKLDGNDKLPNVPTLYDRYVSEGIIPAPQRNGGKSNFFKTGLIYDTRDNEASPSRGIWAEGLIINAPGFTGNKFKFGQIGLTYRQYLTIFSPALVFAYRVGYQNKIYGDEPFYLLPYLFTTYKTYDAFGGVKTLRGILAQRVQGNGILYGNFEFRYKVFTRRLFNQNFYVGLNAFSDWGTITNKYLIDASLYGTDSGLKKNNESLHVSAGGGLKLVMNRNFILSMDYGKALSKNDGTAGLYVNTGYLF